MANWLDDEKKKQEQQKIERQNAEQQKKLYENEVNNFINTHEKIETFVNYLNEYLGIAKSAGVCISSSVNKKRIHLFNVIKQSRGDQSAVAREIEFNFSYNDKGYQALLFEYGVIYRDAYRTNEEKVLKVDSEGNYRWVIEYEMTSSKWEKIENSINDKYKVLVRLSEINPKLIQQIVTWISNKTDSIYFFEKTIKTNFSNRTSLKYTTDKMLEFGSVGAVFGVVVGFLKGCSLSAKWETLIISALVGAIIGVIYGWFEGRE